jgi:hypothetical protein
MASPTCRRWAWLVHCMPGASRRGVNGKDGRAHERIPTMSAQEPYGPASDPRAEQPRRSRRGCWFGALAVLLIVAIVAGVLLYNFLTAYFAMNGAWYGPMKIQTGPTTVTMQAYMDLSTTLNGDLTGAGKLCYKNPLGGGVSTVDTGVTGHRDNHTLRISFAASTNTIGLPYLGIVIGPGLDLHGSYTTAPANTGAAGILVNGMALDTKLSGDVGAAPVALVMKHGSAAAFAKACDSQPAVG